MKIVMLLLLMITIVVLSEIRPQRRARVRVSDLRTGRSNVPVKRV